MDNVLASVLCNSVSKASSVWKKCSTFTSWQKEGGRLKENAVKVHPETLPCLCKLCPL